MTKRTFEEKLGRKGGDERKWKGSFGETKTDKTK
jgi:hypothetical protein